MNIIFEIILSIVLSMAIGYAILGFISLAKCSIVLFKSYRLWKRMQIGDVYEYTGIANKENPFERFSYTIRVTVNDIRENWIQYTEEYIPETYKTGRIQVTRSEYWWYVMKNRAWHEYKKIENNTKF